jgi:hypothetical protein
MFPHQVVVLLFTLTVLGEGCMVSNSVSQQVRGPITSKPNESTYYAVVSLRSEFLLQHVVHEHLESKFEGINAVVLDTNRYFGNNSQITI